jgi:hypothetical protein
MRGGDERSEESQVAIARMDVVEIGDVVSVVAQRRRKERLQRDAIDSQRLKVIQLVGQPRKSPMPSLVASKKHLTWVW